MSTQFPDLFRCAEDKEANDNSCMNRIGGQVVWCPAFRRSLKDYEESQFISLLNSLNDINIQDSGQDATVWEASKDGTFSISSFFKTILNNLREKSIVCSIWKLNAPPRVINRLRVAGSPEKNSRHGYLEERDDYSK